MNKVTALKSIMQSGFLMRFLQKFEDSLMMGQELCKKRSVRLHIFVDASFTVSEFFCYLYFFLFF